MSIEAGSLFAATAPLVTPSTAPGRNENLYVLYRAAFRLPETPKHAVLRFYATAFTEITLDGELIHRGPCRSTAPRLYYDELILTLTAGEHRLSFRQCVEFVTGEFGILCELETDTAGKTRFFLQDPADFTAGYPEDCAADAPLNSGTGHAEYVRLHAPALPDPLPAAKATAMTVDGAYWRKRPIPLFREAEVRPVAITAEPGNCVLADFGAIRFGHVELDAVATGQPVVVEYIEDLKGGWITPTGSCVMYTDRISDATGAFHWKGFHKRACRYLRIRNVVPESANIRIQEYNYPVRELGSFHSSDPFLNRLAEISAATLKVCMDDLYNDCPHRDQAQWMDSFASAQAALGLFGVRDLTHKCLIQYGWSLQDGRLLSPSLRGVVSLPDYALVFVAFVLWSYRATGETGPLAELAENIDTVLRRFRRYAADDGLLENAVEPPDFLYLDNTFELAKSGKSAGLNALYLRALADYAEICAILGKTERAAEYRALADRVRTGFLRVFRHPCEPECFTDTDRRSDQGFRLVNFSCELGHWSGGTGVLEFDLEADTDRNCAIDYADYAGIRIRVDGVPVLDRTRPANWCRQPMYDPETVLVPLHRGRNRVRFEVCSNALNWELFFRSELEPRNPMISECAPDGGDELAPPRPLRLREWVPPLLSQSTAAYAGFAGVHGDRKRTLAMLRRTIRTEYPRTYKSVRVPSFCVECGSAEREKEPWIMPANTPWPTFFLLTALFDHGGGQEALDIIRRYWRDMIADGAVSTYEEWGSRSSLCHAWGAAPVHFLLREILGVRHDTLYTGKLLVRPCLYDLAFAEGAVAIDAATGDAVAIKLRRENGAIAVTLQAPPGIAVELDLSLLDRAWLTPECAGSIKLIRPNAEQTTRKDHHQ